MCGCLWLHLSAVACVNTLCGVLGQDSALTSFQMTLSFSEPAVKAVPPNFKFTSDSLSIIIAIYKRERAHNSSISHRHSKGHKRSHSHPSGMCYWNPCKRDQVPEQIALHVQRTGPNSSADCLVSPFVYKGRQSEPRSTQKDHHSSEPAGCQTKQNINST